MSWQWHLPGVTNSCWQLPTGGEQPLPVVPFLGQQLLELSQRHHAPLDEGAVGDGLPAEVISDHDVLAGLGCATARPLLGLQPAGQRHKRPAQCQPKGLRTIVLGTWQGSGLLCERSRSGPPRAGGNAPRSPSTTCCHQQLSWHTPGLAKEHLQRLNEARTRLQGGCRF